MEGGIPETESSDYCFLLLMWLIYVLPSMVAWFRKTHPAVAVTLFDLFLAWTGAVWLILLVYASFVRRPGQNV